NGTVNNEVSHALDLMDCGADVKKIWRRLDDYVAVDSQAPGVEDCPEVDLTTRMSAAMENLVHDLVHVYDWILLPASIGERYFVTGEIGLSRFPCHQLNGSFCALTAMRKTVQWYCQGVFDENAPSTVEATREWTGVSTGAKKQKLNNYFNQFTDHISTQNGFLVENEVKTVPSRWVWSVPTESSKQSMGIIRMSYNDAMSYTRTGPQLLCLSEMEEWNRNATIPHNGLIEWRLMGRTMVPTAQAYGSGLEHDCSTWDEMYGEDDGEDRNAWNVPTSSTAGMTSQGSAPATVLSQVANALNPVALRMNGNAKNPVMNAKSSKK
ncbi:NLRC3, partial [Symbiodinium sp. CCMP2456]